jgi:hypothetical protein
MATKSKPESKPSKTAVLLKLLRRKNGASMGQLMAASGWQAHSVRGFLAGAVKDRLGLTVESKLSASGERRYSVRAGS